jgi:hypothetical protein
MATSNSVYPAAGFATRKMLEIIKKIGMLKRINNFKNFIIVKMGRDSSVGIAMNKGWMIGVRIPTEAGNFLFDTVSKPARIPPSLLSNG